jgi:hypothetical protein
VKASHIPRPVNFHLIADGAPHITLARAIFLVTLLIIGALLGWLKAPWWAFVLSVWFVWLVRFTSRWESV